MGGFFFQNTTTRQWVQILEIVLLEILQIQYYIVSTYRCILDVEQSHQSYGRSSEVTDANSYGRT